MAGIAHAEVYQIAPGEYLAAGDTTGTTCSAGNFCPGLSDASYNANADQGLTSCSTVGDNSYTQSDTGASANTDCYKSCTTANVAHSATVTGKDYYGSGTDTCSAATCENGYHTEYDVPDLGVEIGTQAGIGSGYISNDGNNKSNESIYGLAQNGTFVVDYDNGKKIKGRSQCSTQVGIGMWTGATMPSEVTTSATLPDSSGSYCYCQLDGYTLNNATMQNLSSFWVFITVDSGMCLNKCAYYCALDLKGSGSQSIAFRTAVFNAVDRGTATCDANTFNITWNGVDAADVTANNAGTMTYGENIRTPRVAPAPRPGQVFLGWKFYAALPSGYTRLKYIESTGTQWIDTGIKGHMSYKYEIDFQPTDTGAYRNWGVFNQSSYVGPNMSLTFASGSPYSLILRWEATAGQERLVTLLSPMDTNRHNLQIDNGKVYFDNVSKGISRGHNSSFVLDYNLFLGTVNPGGTIPTNNSRTKFFSYKVYDNAEALIQNFIPARRDSDGVLGMYDTVSNTFFTNAGTGTFVAGPEIGNLPQ